MTIMTDAKDGVMGTARTMVDILYDHMDRGVQTIDTPTFGLRWHLGEQRLGDGCKDQVLTLTHYDLRRAQSKRAVTAHFIATIIRGRYPMPRKPLSFLHFKAPPFNVRGVLMQLHFNPYQIGSRLDYWHVVDGQGELL
ncbi:hypothetical protein GFL39_26375 [Rhizobium leguminosarum bv. viciae]|uniref:hypothetical protein n=1 Tax=Rhizobium leguminosarum TaxID=384 RepID=UPI00144278FF|nr:hypothetical protein [Rhizobium leguminosarum]NKL08399.1 hypothetical protein [Rhizobium leguminosarum bv. viciae]